MNKSLGGISGSHPSGQATTCPDASRVDPGRETLVDFFRNEGFDSYGRKGDCEGWQPEQTAVHFLSEHLACVAPFARPIPMILTCPSCGERHIDEGEFADRPHHTHACQGCGMVWRPAKEPTVGVQFLPGFKNEVETSNGN